MFRPPPTIIEVGTEEDIRQFEEIMGHRTNVSASPTPSNQKARKIFESPDIQARNHQISPTNPLATPIAGSFGSPF